MLYAPKRLFLIISMLKKFILYGGGILLDIVVINLAIIIAYLLRFNFKIPPLNFSAYLTMAPYITSIYIFILSILGLYNLGKLFLSTDELQMRLLKSVTCAHILSIVATYIHRSVALSFPTSVFIISWILNLVMLGGWRLIAKGIIKPKKRVFVLGEGKEADIIKEEIKKYKKEYILVNGDFKTLPSLIKANKITDVVLTSPYSKDQNIWNNLLEYEKYNIKFMLVPDIYDSVIGKLDSIHIDAVPLIEISGSRIIGYNKVIKRLTDILLSLLILLISLPLFGIIAILIKLDSRGSIFYKQERVGKDGKIFNLYKLRTMYQDAESYSGPVLAKEEDRRITKVGKFLRYTRLDELPQLVNVLLGSMSLVGPRPERPYFVEKLKDEIPLYMQRLKVRPGITGLAQVNADYDTPFENKLKYDLLYIKNYSLFLDLKILLKTIWTVVTFRGAR